MCRPPAGAVQRGAAAFVAACVLPLPAPASAATNLVSINHSGTDSGGGSLPGVPPASGYWVRPQISAEGRFVLFGSYAEDLVTTPYAPPQVFVRDVWSETTHLVNVTSSGVSGNAKSWYASFTPDGRYVVFQTESTNLSANDPDSWTDVYLHDLQTGATTLVSANDAGEVGDRGSSGPVLTPDGRFVAFDSGSDNLAVNATEHNVYVRDVQSGTTILVSRNITGTGGGNDHSRLPSVPTEGRGPLSADGRFVAFQSNATDLVAVGAHGGENVYVRDLQAGFTELISINLAGTFSGNAGSDKPAMTPDGQWVVFTSRSSDLVPDDLNGSLSDVFVRDRDQGVTRLVSKTAAATGSGNAESGNFWPAPQISPDGRWVVFVSMASDLALIPDSNGLRDVFVRDLLLETTTLVSVDAGGAAAGNGSSVEPRITDDGRYVFFTSLASNLVPGDDNGVSDVFARDLLAGTTALLTVNGNGDPAGGAAGAPSITPFGEYLAFVSSADDVAATDTNEAADVFHTGPHYGTGTFADVSRVPEDVAGVRFRVVGRPAAQAVFHLELLRPAAVEVDVMDVGGRRVARLAERSAPAGKSVLRWDGRTAAGSRAGSGVYFGRAVARGAHGVFTRTAPFAIVR